MKQRDETGHLVFRKYDAGILIYLEYFYTSEFQLSTEITCSTYQTSCVNKTGYVWIKPHGNCLHFSLFLHSFSLFLLLYPPIQDHRSTISDFPTFKFISVDPLFSIIIFNVKVLKQQQQRTAIMRKPQVFGNGT